MSEIRSLGETYGVKIFLLLCRVLKENQSVGLSAGNLLGLHSEVVKFLKSSRLLDSLIIDLSEAHSMVFIDAPSPELSLGVDSNSEVVTDGEINEFEVLRLVCDLFEELCLADFWPLS